MHEPFEPGPDVEGAGAEWAEESFVSGEGEEVDVHGLDVDGHVADGLGGVDEEWDGHVAADGADVGDGLEGAGDVGAVDDGDDFGVGSDGVSDAIGVDEAGVVVGFDAGVLDGAWELVGEGLDGAEHGVVLHGGDDGVDGAARGEGGSEEAFDGGVEGVGGVEREDDVVGGLAVDEFADAFAAVGEDVAGFACFAVGAASGRGAVASLVGDHGFEDRIGLGEAGGRVVEIES